MATNFIGKPISLISQSDIRYRGILAGIDPVNSTIQLQNVYSMGTEDRRPPAEFIPQADQPYQYIVFRASEVKDLAVEAVPMEVPQRRVHEDPAIIGMSSGPPPSAYAQYQQQYAPQMGGGGGPIPPQQAQLGLQNQFPPQMQQQPMQPHMQPQQQSVPPSLGQRPPGQAGSEGGVTAPAPAINGEQQAANANGPPGGPVPATSRRPSAVGSVHTANASLEKVERAMGELRVSNGNGPQHQHQPHGGRGGGRRGPRGGPNHEIQVPATDFDFQSSNARFDKGAIAGVAAVVDGKKQQEDDERTNPSDDEKDADGKAKIKDKTPDEKVAAYNPQKSFFDSLSSSSGAPMPRGGGRGRGGGRSRRDEEREKNVATFGEPGGVGLMGPGAYVGGYGGHGRRGRGGRRGAPAVVAGGGR